MDIYIDQNYISDVGIYLWRVAATQAENELVKLLTPTGVSANPGGETILKTYNFAVSTAYTRYVWTPTFSGSSNPTVGNINAFYSVKNGVLYAGGRFNITALTTGATTFDFDLPVTLGSDRSSEPVGILFTTNKILALRWSGTGLYPADAGGNYAGQLLTTGYWSFQVTAPIYN